MLDIYDAGGYLDRAKVQALLEETLGQAETVVKVIGWASARLALAQKLTALLDEVAEGYGTDPLDSPDMVRDYISSCRPGRPPVTVRQRAGRAVRYAGPTGRERPGEHWNARIIREMAEAGAAFDAAELDRIVNEQEH